MRKTDVILKDFVSKLNLDDLKYLSFRLEQRISGDLPEALELMAEHQELDRWLASAKSSNELYDMIDTTQEYIDRELCKRSPEFRVA